MGGQEAVGLYDTVFLIFSETEFLAGGPFDPQSLGIGVGFRFGVVGG